MSYIGDLYYDYIGYDHFIKFVDGVKPLCIYNDEYDSNLILESNLFDFDRYITIFKLVC